MHMVIGCSTCSHRDCPLSDPDCAECAEGHQVIAGWQFSLVCALVFILPIALAVVGSLLLQGDKAQSLLGGIAGFAIGGVISTAVTRICSIERQELPPRA